MIKLEALKRYKAALDEVSAAEEPLVGGLLLEIEALQEIAKERSKRVGNVIRMIEDATEVKQWEVWFKADKYKYISHVTERFLTQEDAVKCVEERCRLYGWDADKNYRIVREGEKPDWGSNGRA